jgi:fructose-1,6-bisphosphatase/inositol monophosphatase family enzyme
MIDRIEAVLREAAGELVLPRFRNLAEGDVHEKSPGDLVTVVDREVEAALSVRLAELWPGSLVVGEEAVAADHRVLERLGDPGPVWVIDPIDGTGNFAAGREPFAMMVALLRGGAPVLSVIYEPVPGTVAAAESGGGSTLDGEPVSADHRSIPTDQLRGALATKYLPEAVKAQLLARTDRLGAVSFGHHCAGREYPDIVRGRQQFALFWKSLPWDHSPGALFLREAGGVVRHFDGAEYDPALPRQGLLACRDDEIFWQVQSALLEGN